MPREESFRWSGGGLDKKLTNISKEPVYHQTFASERQKNETNVPELVLESLHYAWLDGERMPDWKVRYLQRAWVVAAGQYW